MKKVFIDTDILIDFFCGRSPFFQSASTLLSLIQEQKVKGYISVLTFSNLNYLISKFHTRAKAIKCLKELCKIVELLDIKDKDAKYSLENTLFNDLEDAIQYSTALSNKMNFIITRNGKDFKNSCIPVMHAAEFNVMFKN